MIKYIDEYRESELARKLADKIREYKGRELRFMEVCGGHTMAVHKFGLHSMLPDNVRLISGPGCPVCVTSKGYIDNALRLSESENVILATYGDLIRVPGTRSSLEKAKAEGAQIEIVYSSLEAVALAVQNPGAKVVFLGIGFETTAPTSAAAILEADRLGLSNFFLFSAHKIMPPAMKALVDEGIPIDGYVCPGHVSTITGSSIYESIAADCKKPCVIAGFEPSDILLSIYMLVKQVAEHRSVVEIQYKRAVRPEGNMKALAMMNQVFSTRADWWRGLGEIPGSGLEIREQYERFDAEKHFKISKSIPTDAKGCICGKILKGLSNPNDCRLFMKTCTPENPVGACMVSGEGACQAFYKYRGI